MTGSASAAARFDLATPADIRFGAGRVAELPAAWQALGVSRVFVVTGADPARAEPVCRALTAAGLVTTTFPVAGEPSVDTIRAGAAHARRFADPTGGSSSAGGPSATGGPSASGAYLGTTGLGTGVLGYGGGSALDAAKAIAVLAASGRDPLDHLEVVGAGRPVTIAGLPCTAVPTTAGTGSEVTRNSVLSAGAVKASLRSPLLLPRVAIVDPDLLAGAPPTTVAASGSDALSQLIEPFLSVRANPVTDALAREGIRRSARSLLRGWREGLVDPAVREDLALASLLGGLCLANSGLGAVHGFAAVLGARYAAPHGAVCAALLPAVVSANLTAARCLGADHPVIARVAEVAALLTGRAEARPEDAVTWLHAQREALGVAGLAAYGARVDDEPEVVAAAKQASSMKANPIELDDATLAGILTESM